MRYVPDRKGLEPLLQSDELQDVCVDAAGRGRDWVLATGPRDTGEYLSRVHVERGRSQLGDRTAALLVAGADHSAALEFGNKRSKERQPLRAAIDIIEGG